jgi:hypothetical protein
MEMPPPPAITSIPEVDRPHRLRQNQAFFFIDERRLFINAYLHLFLEGQSKPFFSWSLWVELSTSEYHILQPLLATGNPVKFRGRLAPPPLLYPAGEELSCDVIVFPDAEREPEIIVLTPGELMTDQATPITAARVQALMARVHHHPEDLVADNPPFAERFRAVLAKAQRLYLDEGKGFCLGIAIQGYITLQVGSSAILENTTPSSRGFGIHLPLDASCPENRMVAERMRQWPAGKDFACFDLDGVLTYQFDVEEDEDKLTVLVKGLIADVFLSEVENAEFDLFEV